MGKDKGIQCIPENLNTGREDQRWRGRNRKGEKDKARMEGGRGQKLLLNVFIELPNLFTSFMPLWIFSRSMFHMAAVPHRYSGAIQAKCLSQGHLGIFCCHVTA